MTVEQFVMAYGAEQDRLRALLPEGFASLRPVLRINAEVRDGKTGALEFNTAAEKADNRGWVNIGRWDDVPFTKDGKKTTFTLPELTISFTGVGIEGGCPAEKDNVGCYYLKTVRLRSCPRRGSQQTRNSATVNSPGALQAARTVSALAKRCPPSPKRRRRTMKRRLSRSKMPPSSPACRCWEPIR